MSNTYIKLLIVSTLFALLIFIIGSLIPDKYLVKKYNFSIQRIIYGWALLNIIVRWPYRYDLPEFLAYLELGVIFLVGMIISINRYVINGKLYLYKELSNNLPIYLFLILPGLLIFIAPLFFDGAIFYRNYGPDLDGNLITTSYLSQGNMFTNMVVEFKRSLGSFNWWYSIRSDNWNLPDIRESIAIEFFIRSVRWGHASIGVLLNSIFTQKVWFGLSIQVLVSLILLPIVIYYEAVRLNFSIKQSILLTYLAVLSQSYILMHYEGIDVQLIATPFLVFLIFLSPKLLFTTTSWIEKILYVILVSAMMTFFGEGIQLLSIYLLILMAINIIYPDKNIHRLKFLKLFVLNSASIVGLLFLLSPAFFSDYIFWTIVRLGDKFDGGALHYDFVLSPILLSIPYAKIVSQAGAESISILFRESNGYRIIEASLLMFISALVFYKNKDKKLLAVSATFMLLSLIGHRYAIWKALVIFQPLFLICIFKYLLIDNFKLRNITQRILIFVLVINLVGFISLIKDYKNYAIKLKPEQFLIAKSGIKSARYAVITPSINSEYLLLGNEGPIIWMNSGLRQFGLPIQFNSSDDLELQIALYYDCESEGINACQAIQRFNPNLSPRTLKGTEHKVKDFLLPTGKIDFEKVNKIIRSEFGL